MVKVSICCICYNQENFIGQALDSFLLQKTNFSYEIIIGDDCSTDNTMVICEKYANDYPGTIRLVRNKTNIGVLPNFIQTLNNCSGLYIAICEGDDYWCDPNKLQKQVDFLDTHPEYVGCFHNTEERFEDDNDKPSFLYCDFHSSRKISFADLSYCNLIPTCSVVFKNKLFPIFPKWLYELRMGDWPLHLLNSQFGDYWYIPKIMGVHRLHKGSIWMLQDSALNNQYVVDAYNEMIRAFADNPILQQQLITAKREFNKPPINTQNDKRVGLLRKGIDLAKRVFKKTDNQ
jgi:glycosyltransferase involved in cell wall biosynthesis